MCFFFFQFLYGVKGFCGSMFVLMSNIQQIFTTWKIAHVVSKNVNHIEVRLYAIKLKFDLFLVVKKFLTNSLLHSQSYKYNYIRSTVSVCFLVLCGF